MAASDDKEKLTLPNEFKAQGEAASALLVMAAFLEPEEISAVASGKMKPDDLLKELPKRAPGQPEFSPARLQRALGVHNPPDEVTAFIKALNKKDGGKDSKAQDDQQKQDTGKQDAGMTRPESGMMK